MNTNKLRTITLVVLTTIFLGAFQLQAQRGQMRGMNEKGVRCNIPDLTEEQQNKIDDLRTDHQKSMLQYRNQMQEKRAKLNTLRTAEKTDMTAIDKTIDEIGTLQTQMMKERETHHQKVRGLLTDKQKVFFDTRPGRGFKGEYGMRNGRGGHRGGYGPGCFR